MTETFYKEDLGGIILNNFQNLSSTDLFNFQQEKGLIFPLEEILGKSHGLYYSQRIKFRIANYNHQRQLQFSIKNFPS